VLPQFAVLVSTFAVIEVSWYGVYAGLGARIGDKLKSASVAQATTAAAAGETAPPPASGWECLSAWPHRAADKPRQQRPLCSRLT